MYGMKRTTVYLPDELKARLEAEAARRGTTEAEVIRDAVDKETQRRRPRGGLFRDGRFDASKMDEYLVGFGDPT